MKQIGYILMSPSVKPTLQSIENALRCFSSLKYVSFQATGK